MHPPEALAALRALPRAAEPIARARSTASRSTPRAPCRARPRRTWRPSTCRASTSRPCSSSATPPRRTCAGLDARLAAVRAHYALHRMRSIGERGGRPRPARPARAGRRPGPAPARGTGRAGGRAVDGGRPGRSRATWARSASATSRRPSCTCWACRGAARWTAACWKPRSPPPFRDGASGAHRRLLRDPRRRAPDREPLRRGDAGGAAEPGVHQLMPRADRPVRPLMCGSVRTELEGMPPSPRTEEVSRSWSGASGRT